MPSVKRRRAWRTVGYVAPLVTVIGGGLIWSGYATFHYAESPVVPSHIAWTLCLVLDGAVIVTTPAWLSTVLPQRVRTYAGIICALALSGSMAINYAETGWVGLWAPLIAAALIHLTGVVLRAFARADREADEVAARAAAEAELKRVAKPSAPRSPAVRKSVNKKQKGLASTSSKRAYELLDEYWETTGEELSGARLTERMREEGHDVNENYGRSVAYRWRQARAKAAAEEAVV